MADNTELERIYSYCLLLKAETHFKEMLQHLKCQWSQIENYLLSS